MNMILSFYRFYCHSANKHLRAIIFAFMLCMSVYLVREFILFVGFRFRFRFLWEFARLCVCE